MKFPTSPSPIVSPKYEMIDTNLVIANMADLGYEVAQVKGRPMTHGFHSVDFRLHGETKAKGEEFPRVLFMNSYDGTFKARAVAGVFRLVCSNGMVAGDVFDQTEKVAHIGDAAQTLISRVSDLAKRSAGVLETIGKARSIQLSPAGQMKLVEEAVDLSGRLLTPEEVRTFNQPRRREDVQSNLWTTFNRVQENLLKGGIPYTSPDGKIRTTRPVKDAKKDAQLNSQLWKLFEETLEAELA